MKFSDYVSPVTAFIRDHQDVDSYDLRQMLNEYAAVVSRALFSEGTAADQAATNAEMNQLDEKYGHGLQRSDAETRRTFLVLVRVAGMEQRWAAAGRPYYNIWPSMEHALQRCNLSGIYGKHIVLPIPTLLLRLPGDTGTVLVEQTGSQIFLTWGDKFTPNHVRLLPIAFDRELTEILSSATPKSDAFTERMRNGMSMVASLALLRDNPDIIQPIPLNVDIRKYEQTQDAALIERAKRKGLFGFNVGRTVESAPGFRRPHFGIRWKGRGGTIPELVPIRGCMVKKKVIMEVPTGYLDEEGIAKGDET